MVDGWIKLNRKLLQSPCFQNRELLQLWIWLLLTVNHENGKCLVGNQVVDVLPGQTVTGRHKMEAATGLNRSKIERLLKVLEIEQQIEQQTFTKYRIITITNWNRYQHCEQQIEQQVSNKRATSEHKQECKEGKEGKEEDLKRVGIASDKPKRTSAQKMTDEEWITSLKANPAYQGLNIEVLQSKMEAWCNLKGKKPTRARLLNWLNREDKPMASTRRRTDWDALIREAQEKNSGC
jgi:hypothetical protein